MKLIIADALALALQGKVSRESILALIEVPPSDDMGDFAFPCFTLAKIEKKSPALIAEDLKKNAVFPKEVVRVEVKAGYLNLFLDKKILAAQVLSAIESKKDAFGTGTSGSGKTVVLDMSSPNIAKPFGIGHLRSTLIGNSLAKISAFQGFKTVKINYLGDWGTQFGKLIVGYKRFGSPEALKENPIKHLLEVYVKVNEREELEQEARDWFKKLEQGDAEALDLWRTFKDLSLTEFNAIYAMLGVSFDVMSGESCYNKELPKVVELLKEKGLLQESEGAQIVDLKEYDLGVCLIQKQDGTTLYATRDLAAAIDRYEKYKFHQMIYEVGSEQKLHLKQVFKVLELLGFAWAGHCVHVEHGLYLDATGKKFATRKGRTVLMEEILRETVDLAKEELAKRGELSAEEAQRRALRIALAAILYGDLKNYRAKDMVFDIQKFLEFEGDTGPYLLYAYARANSIIRKSGKLGTGYVMPELSKQESALIRKLDEFNDVAFSAYEKLSPNLVANYCYQLSQTFTDFYHNCQVIGSPEEDFRIALVQAFKTVLKNALGLLGIETLEEM